MNKITILNRSAPYFNNVDSYIDFLTNSGLYISSDPLSRHSLDKARHYLTKVGTQRFHIYFYDIHPLIKAFPDAQIGVDDVLRLYKFDRKLRGLVLDAIERIEVSVKNYMSTAE